jgi:hypothetical protein
LVLNDTTEEDEELEVATEEDDLWFKTCQFNYQYFHAFYLKPVFSCDQNIVTTEKYTQKHNIAVLSFFKLH